jgi:hypothetical protein
MGFSLIMVFQTVFEYIIEYITPVLLSNMKHKINKYGNKNETYMTTIKLPQTERSHFEKKHRNKKQTKSS